MQQQAPPVPVPLSALDGGSGTTVSTGSFAQMTAFFREERSHLESKLEQQELKAEQQRQELDGKLEQQRQELEGKLEQQRQLASAAKVEQLEAKIEQLQSDQQLPALQARIEALHAAQLLTDAEMFSIEDVIADSLEAATSDDTRVGRLIALSGRMTGDAAFSRQLRRKAL
jgi:predicted RNase H-like nuclease (RuvC/YqgF family)